MGLLQKACETYDTFAQKAGVAEQGRAPLTPISHIVQNVQIEIIIDEDGNYVGANEVAKDDVKTIIPVTEASAVRTSGCAPHPLCEQIGYISKHSGEKYEKYVEQLSDWADSEYAHQKVRAVLNYVKGGSVLSDLERAGLIEPEGDKPPEKAEKWMVRWRVLNDDPDIPEECWRDATLFDSYIRYAESISNEDGGTGLCMITGDEARLALKHPKGIVSANYGAKLISDNDSSGYTYRGRFTDSRQAATVSYIASQKAHSALAWLAANDSVRDFVGNRVFICWNPKGFKTPKLMGSPMDTAEEALRPSDYKKQLYEALRGYRENLPDNEDVIIAAFDAATTGRLSMTYYSELRASDFLEKIQRWYETCCWEFGRYGVQSPPLKKIAECAFGTQREGRIEADDRVLKEQTQKLLACMIEGSPVPMDIVRALTQKASAPLAYDNNGRIRMLSTACAMIRKYRNDLAKKEEWTMKLDPANTDRSYLFGRLMAVMEKAERDTYNQDEGREPNAIKMQSVYCERPMYAARIIHDKLEPYFERLGAKQRIFYKNLIGEIFGLFKEEDKNNMNKRLEDTYLLGYYLQRSEFYTKKEADIENEHMEVTE